MSVETIYRWLGGGLQPLEYCDMTDTSIAVADSWLVESGITLALGLHRARFLAAVTEVLHSDDVGDSRAAGRSHVSEAEEFWDAAVGVIPADGDWFPRVELQLRPAGVLFVFRLRSAPERSRAVVVATAPGPDPRTAPWTKGPDLDAMLRLRTEVQRVGAREAVILDSDGFVVEGSTSCMLWWRGSILCGPPADRPRVDGVTARSVLTLATALGVETFEESVTPAELDGTELWALNSLHGIRIVTRWVDGPELAELPGRLATWRTRLEALRRPIR